MTLQISRIREKDVVSFLRMKWSFIRKNVSLLQPGILSAKFGCMKFAQWFWKRRKFVNVISVFLLFHNYHLLEKGVAIHLNKLEFPSFKDSLCEIYLKLAKWFLRRSRKCAKFTTTTTDKLWSVKLTWAGSSGAKMCSLILIQHAHPMLVKNC